MAVIGGNNIYQTEEQGVKKDLTCVVMIDIPQLTRKKNETALPIIVDYLQVEWVEDYKNLKW